MRKYFNFKNRGGYPKEIIDVAKSVNVNLPTISGSTSDGILMKRSVDNYWSGIPVIKTSSSFEMLFKFTSITPTLTAYNNNEHGFYAFSNNSLMTGYHFTIGTGPYSNNITINKMTNGSASILKNSTITSISDLNRYKNLRWFRMKYDHSSNTFSFKHWLNDEVEPSTWNITAIDSTYVVNENNENHVHGVMLQGYSNWVIIEAIAYGTDGDTAPFGVLNTKTFYGSVRDKNNKPIPNLLVGLYTKIDGKFVSSTKTDITGNFNFYDIDAYDDEKFYVVAIEETKQPTVISFEGRNFVNT